MTMLEYTRYVIFAQVVFVAGILPVGTPAGKKKKERKRSKTTVGKRYRLVQVKLRRYIPRPKSTPFFSSQTVKFCKVMFCRVCGFRVRAWEFYRTSRSFGYGYGSVTEFTELTSGYCGSGVQNSQKSRAGTKNAVPVPRVLWHGGYRTHRSAGYGYKCHT